MFLLLFGSERFELSYSVIAWIAWVPNLIFAELFIQRNLKQQQKETDLQVL